MVSLRKNQYVVQFLIDDRIFTELCAAQAYRDRWLKILRNSTIVQHVWTLDDAGTKHDVTFDKCQHCNQF